MQTRNSECNSFWPCLNQSCDHALESWLLYNAVRNTPSCYGQCSCEVIMSFAYPCERYGPDTKLMITA